MYISEYLPIARHDGLCVGVCVCPDVCSEPVSICVSVSTRTVIIYSMFVFVREFFFCDFVYGDD